MYKIHAYNVSQSILRYIPKRKIIVLPKEQIFRRRKDRTVRRRIARMSEQRAKNNYRYKRDEAGCRASCSRRLQKVSKIVPERRCVEF